MTKEEIDNNGQQGQLYTGLLTARKCIANQLPDPQPMINNGNVMWG